MIDSYWAAVKILPTDYADYGGDIERWKDPDLSYPDCSSGCCHWRALYDSNTNGQDLDWGVCTKAKAPRTGLLTWEHQAGFGCFE